MKFSTCQHRFVLLLIVFFVLTLGTIRSVEAQNGTFSKNSRTQLLKKTSSRNGNLVPYFTKKSLPSKRLRRFSYKKAEFAQQNKSTILSPYINQLGNIGLDLGFGEEGIATTDINAEKDDIAYAGEIQTDGKIVLVGDTFNGTDIDFGIARYNSDGTLDTDFANNGFASIPHGTGFDYASAVAIQTDGKIIIAGFSETIGGNLDFALLRLESNGTLDPTFGTNGKVLTEIGGIDDQISSIILQTDGKILVAGSTDNGTQLDIALARYNQSGTLDSTFDNDGIVVISIPNFNQFASDISIQSDGKIVICGESENSSNYDFLVARFETNGGPDITFGTNGISYADFENPVEGATSLAIQQDGKIVLGGFTGNFLNNSFALTRFNVDGTIDTSFGNSNIMASSLDKYLGSNGKVVTDFNGNASMLNDLAIKEDGGIVAIGNASNGTNSDIAVAQYLSTGQLNTFFGTGGKVLTAIGETDEFGLGIIIQPNNKFLVLGSYFNDNDDDFAVVRYNALAPTAASTTIGGRILTNNSRGIPGAFVTLTNSIGQTQTVRTNSFGFYQFENVLVGESYIIEIKHKRYNFNLITLNVFEQIRNLNIFANK